MGNDWMMCATCYPNIVFENCKDMFALDIDKPFAPLFGAPIVISEQVVIYRGYDSHYPPISNRITHFGTIPTAQGYAKISPNHRLGCFHTSRPLRLLDLRYIQVLLRELFRTRTFHSMEKMECMARMTLSYGLCSFADQLRILDILMKDAPGTSAMHTFYREKLNNKGWDKMPLTVNPFTPEGVRVGETNNDALSLIALKEIFGTWIDGFISPRMESAFHVEKGGYITAELVLFDPNHAGIQQIPFNPDTEYPPITLDTILGHQSYCHTLQVVKNNDVLHKTTVRVTKGGRPCIGYVSNTDDFFARLESGDKDATKLANKMIRFASEVSKTFHMEDPTAPHPTIPVASWT
jgi:hypothetical protein